MSQDDILKARIRKNLLKDWNVVREYHENETMKRIMAVIVRYGEAGVSHSQLSEAIGKDRKTIRPHLNRLAEMGLVTRDLGKHGKYFPTIKRHRGITISAEILTESFKKRVLDIFNEPFVLNSPHFRRKIPYKEFKLEDAIFNFSNIIGGWITYLLILSMNPANLPMDRKDNIENNHQLQPSLKMQFL
jgi:DNA-binding transcriptional ArsR family regulator